MFSWQLDREGFIPCYMVSGPLVTPFVSEERDCNQLLYEARLREEIARHPRPEGLPVPRAGENSRLGLPWRFYGGPDCAFVNLSEFYSTMKRVEFDAAAVILADREQTVRAVLWSYAAMDVALNGEWIGGIDAPVYKPIRQARLELRLKPGANLLYLCGETLGVRDTRSVFGLQLPDSPRDLGISLPDRQLAESAAGALRFLAGTELTRERLRFSEAAPAGTAWAPVTVEADWEKSKAKPDWREIVGQKELSVPEGLAYLLLRTPVGNEFLTKMFERTEQIRPALIRPVPDEEENRKLIYTRIAEVENMTRGEEFGFPIVNLLARQALGRPGPRDHQLLEDMLTLIDRRVDCADFLVCGLLRYLKNYPVSEALQARIRDTLIHWRYWMDMDGFDGMCFWSENHCLMFYTAAMLAGEMFPEEWFSLAGRSGKELREWGREKLKEWLDDVETWGFEEFLSTVYMCVTFAALVNVVDYAEPELSRRAAGVTDRLLRMLALHTFKGGIIAPQGRVYRGILYPFSAGAMALMNAADPAQPWDLGEGWLAFQATSSYRFPADLKQLMADTASLTYVTGNARIVLEKHEDWCLTSVQIPREPFVRWPSDRAFVKAYNERFHGTTCFQPGGYGYQQHLWTAALDGEAAVFINHPGSAEEGGDMRPGYWHGNGVFPALKQEGSLLGMIYEIPEEHPLHYIHLYCPECRFEEIRREGNWLLLRKGQGYIGLWSSVPMEPWQGMNANCEQRMWGSEIAAVCLCAGREAGSLENFAETARLLTPRFDPRTKTLRAGSLELTWKQGNDRTQYL